MALSFFIRAMSPAVFIVALSALVVAAGYPQLRIGVFWIAPYYYIARVLIILLLNRQRLISWWRYIGHTAVGVSAAWLAYKCLILPNRSLMPDLDAAGNELWLAILAFLYAVANKVLLPTGPGARRRNGFIARHFRQAKSDFGPIIEQKVSDPLLRLIAYSILIYEDYCRPPAIRRIERVAWWKRERTTGIMQVAASRPLSDEQSVNLGVEKLLAAWSIANESDGRWHKVRATIADYNRDDDYIGRVTEVMEIIAKRVAPQFEAAYDSIWSE